jgi:hypothetical protein
MVQALQAAREAGAISIEWDRDAPHLVRRVTLLDADRLYVHLGKVPAARLADAALAAVHAVPARTEMGSLFAAELERGWLDRGRYLGLKPADSDRAIELVHVIDAVFTPLEGRPPLRTRSARLLGDSKTIEAALPKVFAFLRRVGVLDPSLRRAESLRALDLDKYPQPILAAGPFRVRGADVGGWILVGLAPEEVAALDVARSRALLTIENLESFNRYVREARRSDEAVIYTGGFPSHATLNVICRVARQVEEDAVFHWGDVDGGGIAIAVHLERIIKRRILPHLMSPEQARTHGRMIPPVKVRCPATSGFAGLSSFLASADAHALEQEMLDPAPLPLR